jgi:hypothetical protein
MVKSIAVLLLIVASTGCKKSMDVDFVINQIRFNNKLNQVISQELCKKSSAHLSVKAIASIFQAPKNGGSRIVFVDSYWRADDAERIIGLKFLDSRKYFPTHRDDYQLIVLFEGSEEKDFAIIARNMSFSFEPTSYERGSLIFGDSIVVRRNSLN